MCLKPILSWIYDVELQAEALAHKKAVEFVQMPPVLPERDDIDVILSEDPHIAGFDTDECSYVFVDSTLGIPERVRLSLYCCISLDSRQCTDQ